jgi:hypothetical protein
VSTSRILCKHCGKPGTEHGMADNPHRPFACPSDKPFPKWPTSIKDDEKAGALFDRRLAKHWTARITCYEPVSAAWDWRRY